MKVIVIGGGWSGLAAAVRLCEQGHEVQLFEAAKQLGGRARSVKWGEFNIDNGQHLMIGAYQRTLALFDTIRLPTNNLIKRRPLNIQVRDQRYPTLTLHAPHHPLWPLSTLWRLYRDNNAAVLWAILKFGIASLKASAKRDHSVAELLKHSRQPQRMIDQLWEPLCLAMLNTPIIEASAYCFVTALRETFARPSHPDLLIPQTTLGELLPHYAEHWLKENGATIHLQTKVTTLVSESNQITGVTTDKGIVNADHVVVATAPHAAVSLLTPFFSLPLLPSYPIATVYLLYADLPEVAWDMIGLTGTLSQWVFTRHDCTPNLVSVVISGPGNHEQMDKKSLIDTVIAELHQHIEEWPEKVIDSYLIREKRATFAASVNIHQQRPSLDIGIAGLSLAGDLVNNGYPATIEGAIINGENVANNLQTIPRTGG